MRKIAENDRGNAAERSRKTQVQVFFMQQQHAAQVVPLQNSAQG
jgi:hypothetical protein